MLRSPPRPPACAATPGRLTGPAIAPGAPLPYYFPTPTRRNHFPGFPQKRPPPSPTFDFSIPEARLLLTQVPRVARPQNSPPFPRRFSSLRILAKRGLTNGLIVIMIDCMHGAKHAVSHCMFPRSVSMREGSRGGRERRRGWPRSGARLGADGFGRRPSSADRGAAVFFAETSESP